MQVYSTFNPKKHRSYYKLPLWKRRGFYVFIIILSGLLGFIWYSVNKQPAPEPVSLTETAVNTDIARVTDLTGDAFIKKENWELLNTNSELPIGAEVKTGAAGKMVITLPDKSLIRMNNNSEIKLESFGMADIIINQISGTVYHRISPESPAIYHVKNQRAEVIALGTGFNITVGSTINVTVTESRVKAKIYESSGSENIINMRTIDEGYQAVIDLSQPADKMIASEPVAVNKLMENEWLVWNKNQDQALNWPMGVFANNVNLKITKPEKTTFDTVLNSLPIEGETDIDAEIFIAGQEVKNNSGKFSTTVPLQNGKNQIEITVKKGTKLNKEILYVVSNQTGNPITLSVSMVDKNATLSWSLSDTSLTYDKMIINRDLNGKIETKETLKNDKNSFTWENLSDGLYFFTACAATKDQTTCPGLFGSNKLELTVGSPGRFTLKNTITGDSIKSEWTYSGVNPEKFVLSIINLANKEKQDFELPISVATYTFQHQSPGQYSINICAKIKNECKFGIYYDDISITSKPIEKNTLNLKADNSSPKQIKLSWISSGITTNSFNVLASDNQDPLAVGASSFIANNHPTTGFTVSGLEPGKTYHFRVCENINNTCGVTSNEVVITAK